MAETEIYLDDIVDAAQSTRRKLDDIENKLDEILRYLTVFKPNVDEDTCDCFYLNMAINMLEETIDKLANEV